MSHVGTARPGPTGPLWCVWRSPGLAVHHLDPWTAARIAAQSQGRLASCPQPETLRLWKCHQMPALQPGAALLLPFPWSGHVTQTSHQQEQTMTPGLCLFTRPPPSPSSGTPQGLLLATRPGCQLWVQINRLLPLGEQEARQPADTKPIGSRAPALQALICPAAQHSSFKGLAPRWGPFDLAPSTARPPRARVRMDVSVEYTPHQGPGSAAPREVLGRPQLLTLPSTTLTCGHCGPSLAAGGTVWRPGERFASTLHLHTPSCRPRQNRKLSLEQ